MIDFVFSCGIIHFCKYIAAIQGNLKIQFQAMQEDKTYKCDDFSTVFSIVFSIVFSVVFLIVIASHWQSSVVISSHRQSSLVIIVAKGVKISTDQFFPQTNQHPKLAVFRVFFPKISSFSRAFPKNQHRPEKIAPTGRHGRHVFATLITLIFH